METEIKKDYSFAEMVKMLVENPTLKFKQIIKNNDFYISGQNNGIYIFYSDGTYGDIVLGYNNLKTRYTLLEEPFPQLSEEAKTVLRLVNPEFKWIAKDCDTKSVILFEKKPYWKEGYYWFVNEGRSFDLFGLKHLFTDLPTDQPYLIADLIGDGEGKVKSRLDILIEKLVNGNVVICCPYDINKHWDDIDNNTEIRDGITAIGCRGITCAECWNKPAKV